jgi:hypothetical protein
MRYFVFLLAVPVLAQTPLFGPGLMSRWHISEINHHGNTKAWKFENGVLSVTQDTPGNGGILLTNKTYKNFEVTIEIKPDYGCDGGLFLRSTEKGEAYQVLIDYLDGGTVAGIYGERLPELNKDEPAEGRIPKNWRDHWKKDDWNTLRARIEGDVPHIQVWLNGHQTVDWTAKKNYLPGGATSGMIALQTHRTSPEGKNQRWVPGGFHRYRNMTVRELP